MSENPYKRDAPTKNVEDNDKVKGPPVVKRSKMIGLVRVPANEEENKKLEKNSMGELNEFVEQLSSKPNSIANGLRCHPAVLSPLKLVLKKSLPLPKPSPPTPTLTTVAVASREKKKDFCDDSDDDDEEMSEFERTDRLISAIPVPPNRRSTFRSDLDESKWTLKTYSSTNKNFVGGGIDVLVRREESWTVEACPVRTTEEILRDQPSGVCLEKVKVFGLEGVMDNLVTDRLNPITRDIFGATLSYLGIARLDHAGDMSFGLDDGSAAVATRALTFFFTCYPMVNQMPSLQNRVGLYVDDPRYWTNHIYHRQRGTEQLRILELAMRIFPCFLPENEKVQHYISVQNKNGPFVGATGFCLLTCYGSYAYVVAKLLSLPIVRAAMSNNWSPVLCIKDCIHQNDLRYGVNGTKIATCDRQTKSFICLVGFHRQLSANVNDFECISMLNCGAPITLKSQAFIRLGM